jgi:hypothetical protein
MVLTAMSPSAQVRVPLALVKSESAIAEPDDVA